MAHHHRAIPTGSGCERIPINDTSALTVLSEHGRGVVVNFSGTGISLQFKMPLAKGTLVRFSLESRASGLKEALVKIGITEIEAEVRWSYQSAGGFVHGLMFRNVNDDQREDFVLKLSEYAFIADQLVEDENEAV